MRAALPGNPNNDPSRTRVRSALAVLLCAFSAFLPCQASAVTPIERVMSTGGIEAWLMEARNSGVVSMRFSFEGGALEDPEDKPGTAYIAGYLFNEGAGDMETAEFTRRRQRIVADMYGQASLSHLSIWFQVPSVNRREAFDLLAEALHRPRFDAEPFARAKSEAEATLNSVLKSPNSIALTKIQRRLYGDTRIAQETEGTLESLPGIGVDDVKAYRSRLFARSNLKIAVSGDIGKEELGPILDRLFLPLPEKADIRPKPPMPEQTGSSELVRMELPQTFVVFANRAPRMTWRQQCAASIANSILSDSFTGRLFTEVREKRGLVYTISTAWGQEDLDAYFMGSFGAGPENVGPAVDVMREVIGRFLAEGPTEEEVERVKTAFIGGFLLGLDTSDKLTNMMLRMRRLNLPIDLLETLESEIRSISREEVHAVVKHLIRLDLTHTVAIGSPPDGFKLETAR